MKPLSTWEHMESDPRRLMRAPIDPTAWYRLVPVHVGRGRDLRGGLPVWNRLLMPPVDVAYLPRSKQYAVSAPLLHALRDAGAGGFSTRPARHKTGRAVPGWELWEIDVDGPVGVVDEEGRLDLGSTSGEAVVLAHPPEVMQRPCAWVAFVVRGRILESFESRALRPVRASVAPVETTGVATPEPGRRGDIHDGGDPECELPTVEASWDSLHRASTDILSTSTSTLTTESWFGPPADIRTLSLLDERIGVTHPARNQLRDIYCRHDGMVLFGGEAILVPLTIDRHLVSRLIEKIGYTFTTLDDVTARAIEHDHVTLEPGEIVVAMADWGRVFWVLKPDGRVVAAERGGERWGPNASLAKWWSAWIMDLCDEANRLAEKQKEQEPLSTICPPDGGHVVVVAGAFRLSSGQVAVQVQVVDGTITAGDGLHLDDGGLPLTIVAVDDFANPGRASAGETVGLRFSDGRAADLARDIPYRVAPWKDRDESARKDSTGSCK